MQLYRGMDIGTAKLAAGRAAGVPHHLLDVLDVTETATVADYQRHARAAIDGHAGRGRTPVLVGGSGLYMQAVLDDLEFPGTDPAVRARLEEELAGGRPGAARRLAVLDPAAARGDLPGNGRRIVRALEVIELTGRPFRATLPAAAAALRRRCSSALDRDRPNWTSGSTAGCGGCGRPGLVDEVRALDAVGLRDGRTAAARWATRRCWRVRRRARPRGGAERDRGATRRFVRRQRSWFRRDPADRPGSTPADARTWSTRRRWRCRPCDRP